MATRAYRRPLTDADTQVLLDFYRAGRTEEKTFDAGIQRGLERVLAAPSFIFRVNRPDAPELNLASKLSFFLWSSIPDDELLNAAMRGKLKDPAVLEQQVRRMLRDPRANALVEGFATRWLELGKIAGFVPDTQLYPEFDENLREAMAVETKLFVADQLRQDRSVADLLLADYTFANDRLAQHYGIPNVYGSHYRPVKFTDRPPRRTARPGERPVGDVVSESHVGRDARPLAAGEHARGAAASTAARRAGAQGTWRWKGSRNRCASGWKCIARIRRARPAISEWIRSAFRSRTSMRSASGAARPMACRSIRTRRCPTARSSRASKGCGLISPITRKTSSERSARKLLAYAMGRGVEYYDQPAIRKIARDAAAKDYRWSSVILGVVNSTPFSAPAPEARREAAGRPRAGEQNEERPMIISKRAIPRRTMLRGMGAMLALPLLDSMVPALSALQKTAGKPVNRFGVFYVPNGMIMKNYLPTAVGANYELTPTLSALAPYRENMLVVSGLNSLPTRERPGGAHAKASTRFLTNVSPPTSETWLDVGISMDQILAN